jgi:hypothetical protein
MSIIAPAPNPVTLRPPIAPTVHNGQVGIDQLWRLSIEQYHAMIRVGILTADDPVELLGGLLVQKMSKNPPHRVATGLTREALGRLAPTGWYVDSQEPVTMEESEPELDVQVVRGQRRDYVDRHPTPRDVGLAVEVADTTLQLDRGVKKRLYAAARIPVYWIVNIPERQIEVYTDPSGPADQPDYRHRQDYHTGYAAPVVLDGCEIGTIPVAELLL